LSIELFFFKILWRIESFSKIKALTKKNTVFRGVGLPNYNICNLIGHYDKAKKKKKKPKREERREERGKVSER
jgi:hypothetical protein